jgi:hypothetical protein
MILPLALVERWPSEYDGEQPVRTNIKNNFSNIEEALQQTTREALLLYHEIGLLIKYQRDPLEFPVTNKKSASYIFNKQIDPMIRSKQDQLSILLKYSDFPAMVVAAFKEAKLMDKSLYWQNKESIETPVLVRGIANGKICDHVQDRGIDYYFMESGYLGNYPSRNNDGGKKIYHRIQKNAMQQNFMLDVPDDRWKKLCAWNKDLQYQGWRNPGSKILLVAPSDKPCKYYGINRHEWLEQTIQTLQTHTDRPIVVREKASRSNRSQNTLYEALADDIWAVVTYNSIASVEAVHFGVPAFTLAPTGADPVCSKDLGQIESPFKPDENFVYKWLSSIAYGQFSLTEMISGEAWQMVLQNNERPKIKSHNSVTAPEENVPNDEPAEMLTKCTIVSDK